MLIRLADVEGDTSYHVNPHCVVGAYADLGHYYIDTINDSTLEVDIDSYERIVSWINDHEDARDLLDAIASDDGVRHSMQDVLRRLGDA